jgi:hypothetical protein
MDQFIYCKGINFSSSPSTRNQPISWSRKFTILFFYKAQFQIHLIINRFSYLIYIPLKAFHPIFHLCRIIYELEQKAYQIVYLKD